ncbi:MAG: phage Gp37/Gp68 family protein [Candidatus Dormibacteraeota bacterium]|nr:phage Gp37/Gp68 family protein [Candidatus Dormibacteraeota bacterium]
MSDKTAIEWAEATWNPTTGCSKVSPGCAHCYAEKLSLRFGTSSRRWTPANAAKNVIVHPDRFDLPLRWRTPKGVFVDSMRTADHPDLPRPPRRHGHRVGPASRAPRPSLRGGRHGAHRGRALQDGGGPGQARVP